MQARRLEGRVALVTGAASGIGYACARRYAEEGAVVIGVDLRETQEWDAVRRAAPRRLHRADGSRMRTSTVT